MSDKCIDLFRALADGTRQEIMEIVGDEARNVNQICGAFTGMTQPTISHHLQILKRCQLVSSKRKGKMVYYSLNKKVLRNGFEAFIERFDIEIL